LPADMVGIMDIMGILGVVMEGVVVGELVKDGDVRIRGIGVRAKIVGLWVDWVGFGVWIWFKNGNGIGNGEFRIANGHWIP